MSSDAQEAAMGLLSLSPNNFSQLPPVIPQKRKLPTPQTPHYHNAHGSDQGSHATKRRSTQRIVVQYQPPQDTGKDKEPESERDQEGPDAEEGDSSTESIRCICGSTYDDGFSIACDDCSRWCHAACFGIVQGEVPEEWCCWVCVPRPVDRDGAVRLQKERQRVANEQFIAVEREKERQRRRMSPGAHRRHRRASTANNDSHSTKRKRRASILAPTTPLAPLVHNDEDVDVVVDIDDPWTHSYVPVTHDVVPSEVTRKKLRRHAQNWRGITAIEPWSPPHITVQRLPTEDVAVRPPSYAVHTTQPIPSEHLITPFVSTITPSAVYLSDPLNGYAHLGMPKPFVHLIGPPLDLALDARITADNARFVRSGCRPNAVLRPVVCRPKSAQRDGEERLGVNHDETTLSFAVFASRDLKADEEVVLGWEWDDGNAVHSLPALIQTPHVFPPAHFSHLRSQMNNILHVLASTFTTCACGSSARDCALAQMERFVNDDRPNPLHQHLHSDVEGEHVDLGPLIGRERGFRTRPKIKGSGGMGGVEMLETSAAGPEAGPSRVREADGDVIVRDGPYGVDADETEDEDVPLGRQQHERWRGQEEVCDPNRSQTQKQLRPPDPGPPTEVSSSGVRGNGRRRGEPAGSRRVSWDDDPQGTGREQDESQEKEEWMPPKMRKRWIHREVEALKEMYGSGEVEADLRWEMEAKGGAADVDTSVGGREYPKYEDVDMSDVAEHVAEGGRVERMVEDEAPPPLREEPGFIEDETTFPSLPPSTLLTSTSPEAPIISTPLSHPRQPHTTSPSESFSRLSLVSPVISLIPPSSHHPPSSSHHSWAPEYEVHDSPMMEIHSPGDRPLLAGEEDPHPASSPASPDIPPAASPPTPTIEVPGVGLGLPVPAVQLDLEEDVGSPQVLQASWSPLRRASPVTIQDTQDGGAATDDRMVLGIIGTGRVSPVPAPAMDLPAPSNARATDYSPGAHSVEEVPRFQIAAAAPHVQPPPSSIPMDDIPEHLLSTEPPPPIEIRSPTASPHLPHTKLSALPPVSDEPTPGPPPKVKMSLKDFAARRKKRREEEGKTGASASTSVEASPVIVVVGLAADMGVADGGRTVKGEGDGKAMNNHTSVEQAKESKNSDLHISGNNGIAKTLKVEDSETSGLSIKPPLRAKHSSTSPSLIPLTSAREARATLKGRELFELPILSPPVFDPFHLRGTLTPAPVNAARPLLPVARTHSSSRQPSQEEGEILIPQGDTPPVKRLPAIWSVRNSHVPRSHTPPTQPRSLAMSTAVSTTSPPPFSRPPPSGPRALRMSSTFQQPPVARHYPFPQPQLPQRSAPTRSSSSTSTDVDPRRLSDQDRDRSQTQRPPPSAPRGPSADRERVDMDRERSLVARSRVQPGAGGWGR